MKRQPSAVLQHRDHGTRRGVIFLRPHVGRRIRREDIPAQIAPQLLERVDGRCDGRLTDTPDQQTRFTLHVEFPFRAAGTPIPVMQLRMGHVDAPRAGVRLGAVTAVARRTIAPPLIGGGRRLVVGVGGARRIDHADLRQHVTRLLRGGAEE